MGNVTTGPTSASVPASDDQEILHYDRDMAGSPSSMIPAAFVPIVGGWFMMGTERGLEDERPPHRVFVDGFEMGIFPVTRAEYECFVDATGHEPPKDWCAAGVCPTGSPRRWRQLARRERVLSVAVRGRRASGAVADGS